MEQQQVDESNTFYSKLRALFSRTKILEQKGKETAKELNLPKRKVYLNVDVPAEEESDHRIHYVSNKISTAQYNIINFIPVNLYRQFKRAANVYFLFLTAIQMTPYFATGPMALAALPLFAVLFITAFKDGLEDWRRHVNDKQINNTKVTVISNMENKNMLCNVERSGEKMHPMANLFSKKTKDGFPNEWADHHFNKVEQGKPLKQDTRFWGQVRVGDVILIKNGEAVPADMLVLSSSNEDGTCFADSKDLDGETNLKPRSVLSELSGKRGLDAIKNLKLVVEADTPTANMFVFNCNVQICDGDKEKTVAANINNVMFRGMRLKNTEWVFGLVIYTGKQTKVILNSGPPPYKRSKLEKMMNKQVISSFFLLAILGISFSVIGGIMYRIDKRYANLLFLDGDVEPAINGIYLFFSTMILLQNVIPISLYVSIEFIKLSHAFFIYNDVNMYYEKLDTPCIPRNWNISDDMGQISYVFSDKTGTLTRNIMDFRMCSINGVVYGKQLPGDELDVEKGRKARKEVNERNDPAGGSAPKTFEAESRSRVSGEGGGKSRASGEKTEDPGSQSQKEARARVVKNYVGALKKVFDPKYVDLGDETTGDDGSYTFVDPMIFHHMNPELFDEKELKQQGEDVYPEWTTKEKQMEAIDLFLTQLSVCHTVLIESKKVVDVESGEKKARTGGTIHNAFKKSKRILGLSKKGNKTSDEGKISEDSNEEPEKPSKGATGAMQFEEEETKGPLGYSAESPDESALVAAASNLGYTFVKKVRDKLTLNIKGEEKVFQILDTVEFNSTRKRMSVVVRRPEPHNDIVVFTKGADSIVLDLLKKLDTKDQCELKRREATYNQIDTFADAGLRTLALAYRKLGQEEYDEWSKRYRAALGTLESNREELIDSVVKELERDLELVGSTAIEDKLQERVPDCIASLRSAGIKVWVLTGDKMETAINIGFASNLLTHEMEVWRVSGKGTEEDILEKFWLVSKMVHETIGGKYVIDVDTKSVLEESTNAEQERIERLETPYSEKRGPRLYLERSEVGVLKNISYNLTRVIEKMTRLGKVKKTNAKSITSVSEKEGFAEAEKPIPVVSPYEHDAELVKQSITLLRKDATSQNRKSPKDTFKTLAERRLSIVLQDTARSPSASKPKVVSNALVVDGQALKVLLENKEASQELVKLAPIFKSVICCRASPLQKAQVVELVKDGLDVITLAIGDGANDVSMIQAANVGVAITGEEGLQAANASDYTIGRFHFLQNLLMVHGLFNYLRVCESILSFFYKNAIWALAPVWFAFFCRFSGNLFYSFIYIQMYNLVFTVFPVLVIGCMDKPFNYKTAMLYTGAYRAGIDNLYFSNKRYLAYMLDGAYQSAVCFFVYYAFVVAGNSTQPFSGRDWSLYDLSGGVVGSIIICSSLTLGLNAWSWSWLMWGSIAFSILSFFIYTVFEVVFASTDVLDNFQIYFFTLTYWAAMVLSVIIALGPRFLFKYLQKAFRPRDIDIIREIKMLHKPWYGQILLNTGSNVD